MQCLLYEIVTHVNPDSAEHPTLFKSTIWEDNNGCISTAKSPKLTPRTKHIAVKYHYTHTQIGPERGVLLEKIESENQKADIFTKGFGQQDFEHLRYILCGW